MKTACTIKIRGRFSTALLLTAVAVSTTTFGEERIRVSISNSATHQNFVDDEEEEGEQDETEVVFRTVQESQPVQPAPSPFEEDLVTPPVVGGTALPSSDISFLNPNRQSLAQSPGTNTITGTEASQRVTTDAGDLLGRSNSALGVVAQRRTPMVNDPRVRGNRVGSLLASGSYWVPARIDLDTVLSKIDSRAVQDIVVVGGPYSATLGPGFQFVDVELLGSPRFEDGLEWHGTTIVDYKTNGEQVHGGQRVWGGGADWGVRAGYHHRTGNDYVAGNGKAFAASYNSRALDLALGADLTCDSSIEFQLLRLDQTGVEFPGYAFDINYLVTDGYEVIYVLEDQAAFDRLEVETWYNRTRFEGDNLSFQKRQQFPFFNLINFQTATDVDSMSTGFRAAMSWGYLGCQQLTAGLDLRFLKQELNEIASGTSFPFPLPIFTDRNSPIPDSFLSNPGYFVEYVNPAREDLTFKAGLRVDMALAKIDDDPAKLAGVGTNTPQSTYADVVGTNEFDQTFSLWSAFVTLEHQINCCWTVDGGFGYAERPPTLTELYAAEPFMFLLQNGVNVITGDPRLDPERVWQIDVGLRYENGALRFGMRGYHAWLRDYITFENMRTFGAAGVPEQISLKYVNTDRATIAGAELYGEYDLTCSLTIFAAAKYVEGRDHTRNGSFATQHAQNGQPSERVPGLPRGWFGRIPGAPQEPLPGIVPLDSRLGIRLRQPCDQSRWFVELAARVVDNQNRVASSLLETTTPGFTVWDVRGVWEATDQLRLVAGVENFGDKTFREHLDFRALNGQRMLQPGVNFFFGMERSF
jgi:outer membrane receptor protein involved in Fe transport